MSTYFPSIWKLWSATCYNHNVRSNHITNLLVNQSLTFFSRHQSNVPRPSCPFFDVRCTTILVCIVVYYPWQDSYSSVEEGSPYPQGEPVYWTMNNLTKNYVKQDTICSNEMTYTINWSETQSTNYPVQTIGKPLSCCIPLFDYPLAFHWIVVLLTS